MPAAFALSVVMSAVSTAITMSMMRFSVLLVLSFMINQTHPALKGIPPVREGAFGEGGSQERELT